MGVFSAAEIQVVEWLAARRDAMLSLLRELVNIDSGTADCAGVEAVGARLSAFFAAQGLSTVTITGQPFGAGLRVVVPGSAGPSALLMGHLDTVFPTGEAGRRPFAVAGTRAIGPGVADMKAGLVMNAFVLAAFAVCGGHRGRLVGLYTGDEEVGSPVYRRLIEAEAAYADFAFNAEPGRPSGNVVTERRGGAFMRMTVTGKAAHSGIDIRAGISAIEELAHKVLALHALSDFDAQITVNVGVVSGGQSVNTVAPSSVGLIDLRFARSSGRERAMKAIHQIIETSFVPGTSATLEITGEFLPLVPDDASRALFESYRTAAADLGFSVKGEATGACADSGFAAASGATTLCGLGPVGGNAHSPAEYVDTDTIVPRAQALALTIMRFDPASKRRSDPSTPEGEQSAHAPPGLQTIKQGESKNAS